MTRIPVVTITQTRVSFRPGLNQNEKTESVFDAIEILRRALKECQELPHDRAYNGSV